MELLLGTMTSTPGIDVVIVNYNSGYALGQCIDSINQSQNINVFVVDNNSTDNSLVDVMPQLDAVSLIKNNKNEGFATACNQGANEGRAKHIAFINPDCFIDAKQLINLSHELNRHPSAALIGCRVLNENGTLQAASRRRLPTFWRVLFYLTKASKFRCVKGINIKDNGVFNQVIEVEAVNGACVVVNRADFQRVGGFDESYPLHFEDLDLFANLKKTGKKLIYQSNIEVKHLQGNSEQSSNQINLWKKQGLVRYFKKHRPRWEARLITWMTRLK